MITTAVDKAAALGSDMTAQNFDFELVAGAGA